MSEPVDSNNTQATAPAPSSDASHGSLDAIAAEAKNEARTQLRRRKRRRRFERLNRQRERAEKRKKPARSYSSRVTGAFALTAAMTAVILVSILAVVWEGQFQAYTRENIERIANSTATSVGSRYAVNQTFDEDVLAQAITVTQVPNGLAVQVLDVHNRIVYDGTKTLLEEQGAIGEGMAVSPDSNQVVTVPITVDGVNVGTVRVWAFGSNSMLTQYDAQFRIDSYRAVLVAALLAIVIALFVGFVFSRNLVDPLQRVTDAALRVKEGDLTARTFLSGDDEISQLGETFDAMVESMQKERIHERRLTTDVAHELRTPLMAIQATVEGMLDGVLPADSQHLATIDSETRRLSRLVSALLELTKLESGSIPFEFTRLNLTRLIGGLVDSQQALFDATGISLQFAADPDVVVVADSDKLRQATVNLISNAVRYTDEGGHVLVEVRQLDGGEACISVSDDGIGINDADLKRVFSRFWRADEARDRESGGLGIGLAVTSEIVSRHKGRVDVSSEPGVGTTFYLYIPNEPPEEERKKKQQRSVRSKPGGHSKQSMKARQKEEEARQREQARAAEARQKELAKLEEARQKEQAKLEAQERKKSREQQIARARQVDATLRENRARREDAERARIEQEKPQGVVPLVKAPKTIAPSDQTVVMKPVQVPDDRQRSRKPSRRKRKR